MYKEIKKPTDREIRDYMQSHNADEVGKGDNAWTFEEAKYHLLLDDKYYYSECQNKDRNGNACWHCESGFEGSVCVGQTKSQ